MYHPQVVAARQAVLEREFRELLPQGLIRHPVAACHAARTALDRLWDPEKRVAIRPFSLEEQRFVINEQLLVKIDYRYAAERYIWINYEGQALRPMYPLWESQELILDAIARTELEHFQTGHPDGLLFNVLKGRQLGASTLIQSLLGQRVLTHGQVRCLIASDVPQNSGSEGIFGMLELVVEQWPWWLKPRERFHTKDKHIMWATGSRVIVESGKSMKGGLQDDGGSKGQLGRSKTFSAAHLTEIATWERPEQINHSLLPAIPRTPRTLCARESTAMGRHNYWHKEWEKAEKGIDPRFFNVFIPWYAEKTKYWLPYPADWEPATETLQFARRAAEVGPRYMRRQVSLTKEQLRWYELQRVAAEADGRLYAFLSEYPSEPEEAFQNSGRSIFGPATIKRLEGQARGLVDLWTIQPHHELIADVEHLRAEYRRSQEQLAAVAMATQIRQQARVLTTGGAQVVTDEPPVSPEVIEPEAPLPEGPDRPPAAPKVVEAFPE